MNIIGFDILKLRAFIPWILARTMLNILDCLYMLFYSWLNDVNIIEINL